MSDVLELGIEVISEVIELSVMFPNEFDKTLLDHEQFRNYIVWIRQETTHSIEDLNNVIYLPGVFRSVFAIRMPETLQNVIL